MTSLTHRQKEVLAFIRRYQDANGFPPTLREIADHFGLSGPRAAVKHLHALQRKGHITRNPGASRGIALTRGKAFQPPSTKNHTEITRELPVLGRVPAGPIDLAVQEEGFTMQLDPSIARDGTFLLRVEGDSMTGDHILPGDLVLVRKQDTAADGDLVVALLGEEATLKRFTRDGGKIVLMPSNPEHKPVVIQDPSEELRIIGKIRAVIRTV